MMIILIIKATKINHFKILLKKCIQINNTNWIIIMSLNKILMILYLIRKNNENTLNNIYLKIHNIFFAFHPRKNNKNNIKIIIEIQYNLIKIMQFMKKTINLNKIINEKIITLYKIIKNYRKNNKNNKFNKKNNNSWRKKIRKKIVIKLINWLAKKYRIIIFLRNWKRTKNATIIKILTKLTIKFKNNNKMKIHNRHHCLQ